MNEIIERLKYTGLVSSLLFIFSVFLVALLRGDYNHLTQMVSELAETGGSYSILFNLLGYFTVGLLAFLYSFYLRFWFKSAGLNLIATVLVAVHGVGMMVTVFFPCDVSCTPSNPSIYQIGHNILAPIKFLSLVFASLIIGIQFYQRRINVVFSIFSILIVVESIISLVSFAVSIESRDYTGLYQRIFLFSLYIWFAFLGALTRKAPTPLCLAKPQA